MTAADDSAPFFQPGPLPGFSLQLLVSAERHPVCGLGEAMRMRSSESEDYEEPVLLHFF